MDIATDTGLEIKDGTPAETVVTHAEMVRAFEEFKQANDQKLAEKSSVDAILQEKIARIDSVLGGYGQRIDTIELKQSRPVLGREKPEAAETSAAPDKKAASEAYVRSGDNNRLRAFELKALSAGSNPDGGFVVTPEIEKQIGDPRRSIDLTSVFA